MNNKLRDIEFRRWYDARQGTKYESFAYDVWCAAWEAANPAPVKCDCISPERCELYDRCLKNEKR